MNLVYFNSAAKSSVFDSQVLSLLEYYKKSNKFKQIILIFGYQNKTDIEWLTLKNMDGIKVLYYKTYPNYPFFNFLIRKNIKKLLISEPYLLENSIYHILGEINAYHFGFIANQLNIPKERIVVDIRGVSWEEIKEFQDLKAPLKKSKLNNVRKAILYLKRTDKISVVSKALKLYLIYNWDINSKYIAVNNCLVSNDFSYSENGRKNIRNELGLTDQDILIVFSSGGLALWQNNDMILYLAERGFKVLNLSRINYKHKNIINRFVSYFDMPAYLSAADIAFIWRKRSMVNKVASPVKFSEYVACGLPIIHNGTVDLVNEITKKLSIGLLIDDIIKLDNGAVIKLIHNTKREEISKEGKQYFGLEKISSSYINLYKYKIN